MTPNLLDGLPHEAVVFGLETVRVAGVVLVAPLLWADAPIRTRAAIIVLLAFVSHGSTEMTTVKVESLERLVAAVPSELLLGAAMGFVVRLSVAIAEMAGDIMSPMLGLGAASLFNPAAQASETGLTRILRYLCLLLALLLGVHRTMIGALLSSFRVIPVGSLANPGLFAPELVRISGNALSTGLRIAVPMIAALLLIQLALAFVSRAAPSMQIFSVGFAITLASGTIILLTNLPEMAREIEVDLSQVGLRIESVLTQAVDG